MNKKKRLLIATDNFLPRWDGIARFLLEILPELSTEYEITVIAPKFKGKYKKIKDVKVIRLPIHNFRIGDYYPPQLNFLTINKHIKDADIVWVQTIGPIGGASVLLAKLKKKPLIAYTHSIESELVSKSIRKNIFLQRLTYHIVKAFSKFFYNKCDLLMVPSLDTAEILSWQRIKTKKAVVNLGVDTKKFLPPTNKQESKKKIGIKDSIVIGFSGRLGREKDLFTLYRAFLRLHNKYNLKLLIVGSGVQDVTNYLETKKGVIVTGQVENVPDYLHAMDIYVMPSLTETTSLSTMEAMAIGLPVITTPVGHMKNYVEENYNGFHFPKKDHYTLSKELEKLILDKELRILIGNNARNTIRERYKWQDTAQKIKKILSII